MKLYLRTAMTLLLGLAPSALGVDRLDAAELRVLVGGAMTGIMQDLGSQFERASGHKLSFYFGATPQLIQQVTSATPFDLAVVPVELFQDAAARAKFVSGPTTDIARVGYGVAVKAGAPKPDISSPDALKQTLLKAKSITFLPESAAGSYVLKVFDRLGIGEAMKAKTQAKTTPAQIPEAIANGEAELGTFLTTVLLGPGVELVGPFPADLQQDLVFTAGVAADSKDVEATRALLNFLKTPEAVAKIRAKGMTPG